MPEETPPVVETPSAPTDTPVLPRTEQPVTPTDVAEEARQKMAKMDGFWNRVIDKKPEKPEEALATNEDEPTTDEPEKNPKKSKAESPEPEPEQKPRRRKQREQEIDPIQIAEATGRAIASEMAKSKATAVETPVAEAELPDEFKRDTPVFEEMARQDPKKYGNIKKELAKYAAAETEYIAKWEADHPGETFDGESDEHDDFYKRVKPDYDQADFETAKYSLIEQRAAERAEQKARQHYETMEQRRERAAQIQPELQREMVGLLGEMLKEADPDNAELAKDWESIQTLDEKNPLLADIMVMVHGQTKPLIEANLRLFREIDKPDPNNPAHQHVFRIIAEAEESVQRLPVKDRYDDQGRLFTTQEEYAKMTPQDRKRHWYVGEAETAAVIRGRAKNQTKLTYEQESKRLARYTNGASSASKANHKPSDQSRKPTETPTSARPEVASPSVSGRSTLPGDGQPAAKTPSTGKDWFFGKYLG